MKAVQIKNTAGPFTGTLTPNTRVLQKHVYYSRVYQYTLKVASLAETKLSAFDK